MPTTGHGSPVGAAHSSGSVWAAKKSQHFAHVMGRFLAHPKGTIRSMRNAPTLAASASMPNGQQLLRLGVNDDFHTVSVGGPWAGDRLCNTAGQLKNAAGMFSCHGE